METMLKIQNLQLRFIESALVSERCASDLLTFMQKLEATESPSIISMIVMLQNEAEFLRKISQEIRALHKQ